MDATITLREYLKKKNFVIPYYQRGYVWGKNRPDGRKNSVSYLLEESLIPNYKSESFVFLQGITVFEDKNQVVIIDGQQRTTCLFLLLKYLGCENVSNNNWSSSAFELNYQIREKSNDFLKKLNREKIEEIPKLNEGFYEKYKEIEYQDKYFFLKTLSIIKEVLEKEEINTDEAKQNFCEFLLDRVKFLYICIPTEDQATRVFAMMNGSRAEMKAEEVIKAEMLRTASLNEEKNKNQEEIFAQEWDHNMLRSRYAREWDKWLQWWNREDVKDFFMCKESTMGILLKAYVSIKKKGQKVNYASFKADFLKEDDSKSSKQVFYELRNLQKKFEDVFSKPILFNKIGAIFKINNSNEFIFHYMQDPSEYEKNIDKFYKLSFLGASVKQIEDYIEGKGYEVIKEKYDDVKVHLESDSLYGTDSDSAFNLLLRLNIDEDNAQVGGKGRKFDFRIWKERSLEHIYPKSKVLHYDDVQKKWFNGNGEERDQDVLNQDKKYIKREDCYTMLEDGSRYSASEHCIGNLVLLYKNENSQFSDKTFEEKKMIFFKKDNEGKAFYKSRHLLHSIYQFASSQWGGDEIAKNKNEILEKFEEYYKEFINA